MKLDKSLLKKLVMESISEARKKQEEGAESDAMVQKGEMDPNTDAVRSMEAEGPNPEDFVPEIEKYKTTIEHAFVMLSKDPTNDVTIDAVVNVLKAVTKHLEGIKQPQGQQMVQTP